MPGASPKKIKLYKLLAEAAKKRLRKEKVKLTDPQAIADAVNKTVKGDRAMTAEAANSALVKKGGFPETNAVGKLREYVGKEAFTADHGEEAAAELFKAGAKKAKKSKKAKTAGKRQGRKAAPATEAVAAGDITLVLAGNTFNFPTVSRLRGFLDSLQS